MLGKNKMAVYAIINTLSGSHTFLTVNNKTKQCLQKGLPPYTSGSVRLYELNANVALTLKITMLTF